MRRPRIRAAVGLLALAALILQFAGPARTNFPVDASERLEARALVPAHVRTTLQRACYDCHSNETRWPWYSRVAPMSWLVIRDVNEARGKLNFSRWGTYNEFDRADMLDEVCELTTKGKMPLPQYLLMHRDAKLSPADIDALCAWTRAEVARLTNPDGQDRTGMQE